MAAHTEGWLSSHAEMSLGDKTTVQKENREQLLRLLGREVVRPVVTEGAGLMRAVSDFGWYRRTEMGGMEPIRILDVLPATLLPDSPVRSWRDAKTISMLSRAYIRGLDEGTEPLSIPPWER